MIVIVSLIIYLTTIIFTFWGVCIFENKYYISLERKFYKLGYFYMILIPIIISSIRYDVGTDYMNYFNSFYTYFFENIYDVLKYKESMEILPLFIHYITNNITKNPYTFFYITSTLIITLIFITLYKRKEYIPISYSILMYFCIYWGSSFNIIRQSIASVILLMAYLNLERKQLNKFIMYVIFAGLFHRSAFIVLILYPLVSKKIKKVYKFILIILSIIFIIQYDKILLFISGFEGFSKYAYYSSKQVNISLSTIINNLPILLIILMYRKRLISYKSSNDMYIFLMIIAFILEFLGFISPHINRIVLYFDICKILLIPQIICVSKNKKEKMIVKGMIILYSIVYFIYIYMIVGSGGIFPYKTIFNLN